MARGAAWAGGEGRSAKGRVERPRACPGVARAAEQPQGRLGCFRRDMGGPTGRGEAEGHQDEGGEGNLQRMQDGET
jgi:hypothetical protein